MKIPLSKSQKWKIKEFLLIFSFRFFHKFLKYPLRDKNDSIFLDIDTVIHVGAHKGEERLNYLRQNLTVFWIEANPNIQKDLAQNLKHIPNQYPLNALLSNSNGVQVNFHVTNDDAASSLLELGDTRLVDSTQLTIVESLTLETVKLDSLIDEGKIKLGTSNLLLLDVQGAELLVLQGGIKNLSKFQTVMAEAADHELYKNQVIDRDLEEFMKHQNFRLRERLTWKSSANGELNWFELVFDNCGHNKMI